MITNGYFLPSMKPTGLIKYPQHFTPNLLLQLIFSMAPRVISRYWGFRSVTTRVSPSFRSRITRSGGVVISSRNPIATSPLPEMPSRTTLESTNKVLRLISFQPSGECSSCASTPPSSGTCINPAALFHDMCPTRRPSNPWRTSETRRVPISTAKRWKYEYALRFGWTTPSKSCFCHELPSGAMALMRNARLSSDQMGGI